MSCGRRCINAECSHAGRPALEKQPGNLPALAAATRWMANVYTRCSNLILQTFQRGIPKQAPKSEPFVEPAQLPPAPTSVCTVEGGWIVEFGGLVVRSQSFRGGLTINSAKALAGILRFSV